MKEIRKQTVRDAVQSRFSSICETCKCSFEQRVCDEILTDEKLEWYAEMVDENGLFCGDAAACRDLDTACMDKMMQCNAAKYSFEWLNTQQKNHEQQIDRLNRAIDNILA